MNTHLCLTVIGSMFSGALFAVVANAIATSRGAPPCFGQKAFRGAPLGAIMAMFSLGIGAFLGQLALIGGFAIPLGLVGSTAFGSVVFWTYLTVTALGSNAGFKWSTLAVALAFGAVCGLGGSVASLVFLQ